MKLPQSALYNIPTITFSNHIYFIKKEELMFLLRWQYHVYSHGISSFFICATENIMRWKNSHKLNIFFWDIFNYIKFSQVQICQIGQNRWEHHPWILFFHSIYSSENMVPSDSIHTRVCHKISKHFWEDLPLIFICILEWWKWMNKKTCFDYILLITFLT